MATRSINMQSGSPGPVYIGPTEVLWALHAPHRTTGTLTVSSSWLNSVASIDIDNDGTNEWTQSASSPWTTNLVIEDSLLIRISMESTGSSPSSGHNLLLTFDPAELAYDNGPIVTNPGAGAGGADASVLDITYSNFMGRPADWNTNRWIADDFTICDPQGVEIVEMQFQAYQPAAAPAGPVIDGLYVQFFNGDPSSGGQPVVGGPLPTQNLLPSLTVANQPSNIYRVSEGAILSTQRRVFDVHVALSNPLNLSPGTYWIRWAFSGPSGPLFCPPVTVAGKLRTGNGMTLDNGVWQPAVVLLSGTETQGFPFRLYANDPVQTGSFAETSPGCSGPSLDVEGSPTIGGFLHAEIENPTPLALGFIGVGLTPSALPLCGCIAGHEFSVLSFGGTYELDVPTQSSLCGVEIYLQGLEFGVANCPLVPIQLTQTVRATIR